MDLLDLIFPKECLECKRRGSYICYACVNKLPSVKQICPVCKKASIDGFTHPKCTKPQSLDGLIALWSYKGVIRRAVISLKYKFVKEISKELSALVSKKVEGLFIFKKEKTIVTTVPLFWIRKNVRGFNQMDEVAKVVADKFNLEFYPDLLTRKKLNDPQVKLKKEDRVKNIQGVFATNPKRKQIIKDSFVIIIDDVYTTGSTLKEMGKVLKRSGIKEVWGLIIGK